MVGPSFLSVLDSSSRSQQSLVARLTGLSSCAPFSATQVKLPAERIQEIQKAIELFSVGQGPAKTMEEASKRSYQFWDTQPVPKLGKYLMGILPTLVCPGSLHPDHDCVLGGGKPQTSASGVCLAQPFLKQVFGWSIFIVLFVA